MALHGIEKMNYLFGNRMAMFHKDRTDNYGFTIVELLIAMTITIVLSLGVFSAYQNQQIAQRAQQEVVEMQQNLRAALYIMTNEIRMAGYDPNDTYGAGIINAGDGSSDTNRLIFNFIADTDGVDNSDRDTDGDDTNGMVDSGDGNVDEAGELKYVEYYLYDSSNDTDTAVDDLGRRNGARLDRIAGNIQNLQFVYLDENGAATANIPDIRSIQITITAGPEQANQYNTNIQSRTLTSIVKCRNLGL